MQILLINILHGKHSFHTVVLLKYFLKIIVLILTLLTDNIEILLL
jgi:hypothetical protein